MIHLRPFLITVLAVAVQLFVTGCEQRTPKQVGLSDLQVGQFANKYRDEWIATHKSPEADILARSEIQEVKKTKSGWVVRFSIDVDPTSEIDTYSLSINISQTGALDHVEMQHHKRPVVTTTNSIGYDSN